MRTLAWPEIPANVILANDREASGLMLAENVARADLDPIDEGRAYQRRIDAFGLSLVDVAKAVGVTWNRVEAKVRLLRLVPEAQHLIRVAHLKETTAWAMCDLDPNRQRLALAAVKTGADVATIRALCARLRSDQDQESMFDTGAFLQVAEYVLEAQAAAKETKAAKTRRVLGAMAVALADVEGMDDLVAEAREVLV